MKKPATSKKLPSDFPRTPEEIAAVIAAAPDRTAPYDPATDPYDPYDEAAVHAYWDKAVVVHGGGIEAVRKALAEARRKRGQRGPQKAPTKERISLRLPADVLARWKASGPGWQTRMAERLSK
ncbi:MAG: BrnA antitoxin family protein [Panacagrimonas sp.]